MEFSSNIRNAKGLIIARIREEMERVKEFHQEHLDEQEGEQREQGGNGVNGEEKKVEVWVWGLVILFLVIFCIFEGTMSVFCFCCWLKNLLLVGNILKNYDEPVIS